MLVWLVIIVLLGIIFFATLAGAALRAIPVERLRALREKGGNTGSRIEYWITHSEQITWTLRVVIRVSCIAMAFAVAIAFVGPGPSLVPFLAALVATAFLVAFPGSIIPLTAGKRSGEKVGLRVLPALRLFGFVMRPFAAACGSIMNAVLKFLGRPPLSFTPISLTGELEEIVGGGKDAGALDEEERSMIRHIFEFGDTEVSEIMTPRTAMRCLSEDDTEERALEIIREEHHSRIPLYRGSPDNIVGILYAKDLLSRWGEGRAARLGALAREALFVPESKKVDELFDELRRRKTHMAIVVDEYGCTAGLVTMEDVLEKIVGEIQDEYDHDEGRPCEAVGEGRYRADARMSIADAREEMGIAFPESGEYDTLAGFVCSLCGRVPAAGEVIEWGGYALKIIEASSRGVVKLEIGRKSDACA